MQFFHFEDVSFVLFIMRVLLLSYFYLDMKKVLMI